MDFFGRFKSFSGQLIIMVKSVICLGNIKDPGVLEDAYRALNIGGLRHGGFFSGTYSDDPNIEYGSYNPDLPDTDIRSLKGKDKKSGN